jgi:pilus assembly protein Flp/PilA
MGMKTAKQDIRTIRSFLRDERGATAIEYALIAAGIAVAIVTAVNSLGDTVKGMYETVSTAMAD